MGTERGVGEAEERGAELVIGWQREPRGRRRRMRRWGQSRRGRREEDAAVGSERAREEEARGTGRGRGSEWKGRDGLAS